MYFVVGLASYCYVTGVRDGCGAFKNAKPIINTESQYLGLGFVLWLGLDKISSS